MPISLTIDIMNNRKHEIFSSMMSGNKQTDSQSQFTEESKQGSVWFVKCLIF